MKTVLYCQMMTVYVKYEFVLGLISVGDFTSIYLRYNLQISKGDIKMHILVIFEIKSYYSIKQIILSKARKTISFLSSSKRNSYFIIVYGFPFQNKLMIFIHLVFGYVIN